MCIEGFIMDSKYIFEQCYTQKSRPGFVANEHYACKFCGRHSDACHDGVLDERDMVLDATHIMEEHPFEYSILVEEEKE